MSRVFTIDISLVEPAILTDGSSDTAGGHETLSYIPGTSLLGAMVTALGIDPVRDADRFAALFLGQGARYLNAYPVSGNCRSLPRPRTFRQGKSLKNRVIDSVTGDGVVRSHAELEGFFTALDDRMKSAKPAFILPEQPGADCQPASLQQVHVGIARATRAAEQGVLFTYESIPAGTQFRSAIIAEDAAATVIGGVVGRPLSLRIGRSRGAGYGAATATITVADPGWREYEQTARPWQSSRVVVCLLADYVPLLEGPPVAALEADLRGALRLPPKQSIRVIEAGLRAVRGFRGVWGLPRPARTALERGSVVMIDGPLDPDRVSAIEIGGIGGRRNEGFGRLSFGWTVHGGESKAASVISDSPAVSPRPAAAAFIGSTDIVAALAHRRGERLRRRFVEIVLAHQKVRDAVQDLRRIPSSQLGNLRAALTSGLSEADVGRWFKELAQKTAGERWRKLKVRSFRKDDRARRRDGVGFVWTNLLGGDTEHEGRSDRPDGQPSFLTAVKESLVPWCRDSTLHEAVLIDPDRALRLFVVAFCGDVVRARNTAANDFAKETQA